MASHNNTTTTVQHPGSTSRHLHELESLAHDPCDLLVLVRQQAQRECDIVPLPLRVAARQTRRQLVGQLSRVLVLLDEPEQETHNATETFLVEALLG
ncbi:hypothetical protein BN1708_003729 [Verticillium longisporum]|uniref:Uncharacterized protein n=1 Tax=Verticillium longisporum TaxID=100787 RepID=A0A0G4LPN1_VERLO|nr:hypothetical protein BN1708_003729 [Verticillium longisporum]